MDIEKPLNSDVFKKVKVYQDNISPLLNSIKEVNPIDLENTQEDLDALFILIDTLDDLLRNNKEISKSKKMQKYLEGYIEELNSSPVAFIELKLPDKVNKEKIKHERIKAKEHRIQEVSNSGGDATKKIKESKKQIAINEANKLLKNPHDNRPSDRYRASSLAEAIKNISGSTSTIKKYIKEGVHDGTLPSFLLDGKPNKW